MKENNNYNIDSAEEIQKMKISEESENSNFKYQDQKRLIIIFSLIALIIVTLIGLGLFLHSQQSQNNFVRRRVESGPYQPDSDSNNLPNYQNINLTLSDIIEYRPYEMKHYKPEMMHINNYKDLLPYDEENIKITDLSEIFNSKYLFINNKFINFDYIYFVRQNDFLKLEKRLVIYTNSNFYDYEEKERQMPLKEFFDLCENKKQGFARKINYFPKPLISVIIAVYNQAQNLLRTIKSIQNQSFEKLEIIIVEDNNTNLTKCYKTAIKNDTRIRAFVQKEPYGLWRKRMDGFLFSRGKYVLHMDAGDMLSDNLVLEDLYNISLQYDLDSIRFSFSQVDDEKFMFKKKKILGGKKIFSLNETKIRFGKPEYDIHEFGYRTIWNRFVRADMFSKGLDLVDQTILNANKNLWEDMWWNDLVNRVSFTNIIINRLGYIYFYNKSIVIEPCTKTNIKKDESINEFIYFMYFNLILLPKNDDKKIVIDELRQFNKKNNTVNNNIPMRLDFLMKKSNIFLTLIKSLLADSFVNFNDKMFIKELADSIRKIIHTKKQEARLKIRAEREALKKKQQETQEKEKETPPRKAKEKEIPKQIKNKENKLNNFNNDKINQNMNNQMNPQQKEQKNNLNNGNKMGQGNNQDNNKNQVKQENKQLNQINNANSNENKEKKMKNLNINNNEKIRNKLEKH